MDIRLAQEKDFLQIAQLYVETLSSCGGLHLPRFPSRLQRTSGEGYRHKLLARRPIPKSYYGVLLNSHAFGYKNTIQILYKEVNYGNPT